MGNNCGSLHNNRAGHRGSVTMKLRDEKACSNAVNGNSGSSAKKESLAVRRKHRRSLHQAGSAQPHHSFSFLHPSSEQLRLSFSSRPFWNTKTIQRGKKKQPEALRRQEEKEQEEQARRPGSR
jgi:hypothetical protein